MQRSPCQCIDMFFMSFQWQTKLISTHRIPYSFKIEQKQSKKNKSFEIFSTTTFNWNWQTLYRRPYCQRQFSCHWDSMQCIESILCDRATCVAAIACWYPTHAPLCRLNQCINHVHLEKIVPKELLHYDLFITNEN